MPDLLKLLITYNDIVFVVTMLLEVWPLKNLAENMPVLWTFGFMFAFYGTIMELLTLLNLLCFENEQQLTLRQKVAHVIFEVLWCIESMIQTSTLFLIVNHCIDDRQAYFNNLFDRIYVRIIYGVGWSLLLMKLALVLQPVFHCIFGTLPPVGGEDVEAGNTGAGNSGCGNDHRISDEAGEVGEAMSGSGSLRLPQLSPAGTIPEMPMNTHSGNAGGSDNAPASSPPCLQLSSSSIYTDAPDFLPTPSPSPSHLQPSLTS